MHLSFVTPRYGTDVIGGAEGGARGLAEALAARGHRIEVLTTTARDIATWSDAHEAGRSTEGGVTVHRFAVTRPRHPDFDRSSRALFARLGSGDADERTQRRWIADQGPHSPDLLDAVAASDSDVVVFTPYLYEPTVVGLELTRRPSVVHPAAHDEPPLHLPVVRRALARARGAAFYTDAERRLVERLVPELAGGHQVLAGLGVEPGPGDPAHARDVLGLGDRPYALVLGRVDPGKGTHGLATAWSRMRAAGHDLPELVFVGPVTHPLGPLPGVVVTGPVDDEVRWGVLRGARLLVSPSTMESLSLVVLEAMSVGTPVIVHAGAAATVEHCVRSGGGLWYRDPDELATLVSLLNRRAELRDLLAHRARLHVERWFTWDSVVRRYEAFLARVLDHPGRPPNLDSPR